MTSIFFPALKAAITSRLGKQSRDIRPQNAPAWLKAQPFAHRGLHSAAHGVIENSMTAFDEAIGQGYGIELDVQISGDGQALVFHDDSLKRLTGVRKATASITAREARKVTLTGSRDHIPTLAEVLDYVAGQVPVLVEIKSEPGATGPLEQAVAEVLDSYDGPVAIMSFNPEAVLWFAVNRPHICRGFVSSTRYPHELGWKLSHIAGQAQTVDRIRPDFVAYDIRALPNRFTRAIRAAGLPLLTWTVRSKDQHRKAFTHTDGIIFEHSDE